MPTTKAAQRTMHGDGDGDRHGDGDGHGDGDDEEGDDARHL